MDLVLLSHSPTSYLSLYPYARAHWGLQCPVYATQPTVEMGRVICLAEAESWRGEHVADEGESVEEMTESESKMPMRGPFVPTAEEVHEAFDWIKPIRYNQPLHLGGECLNINILAMPLTCRYQASCPTCYSHRSHRGTHSGEHCSRSGRQHQVQSYMLWE